MSTHSSIPAWRIPWTEESARLQSIASQSQTRLSDFHLLTDWFCFFGCGVSSLWCILIVAGFSFGLLLLRSTDSRHTTSSSAWLSICCVHGLSYSRHVRSFWTRDWTDVSCIARQILNHWTTREALMVIFACTTFAFLCILITKKPGIIETPF